MVIYMKTIIRDCSFCGGRGYELGALYSSSGLISTIENCIFCNNTGKQRMVVIHGVEYVDKRTKKVQHKVK